MIPFSFGGTVDICLLVGLSRVALRCRFIHKGFEDDRYRECRANGCVRVRSVSQPACRYGSQRGYHEE